MIKTILIVVILFLIVGLAVGYLVREKRKGKKCIGCPYCAECQKYRDMLDEKEE